jgi:hypothetical protein
MWRALAVLLTVLLAPILLGCAGMLAYAFVETFVGSMALLGLLVLAALAALLKFHVWVSDRLIQQRT